MKRFLLLALSAVVIFLVVGMLEERETFARNWFKPAEVYRPSDADRRAAAETVHVFRTLAAHWYATDGDARFGERLPAAPAVVDELRNDIAYVRRNGRIETPRLMRIEFLGVEMPGDSAAEVRTREFWVTEFRWLSGGPSDDTRSDVLFARYRLERDGQRWIVVAWDPVASAEEPR